MKGYRTILFNAAIAGLTAAWATIDPTVLSDMLGKYGGIAIPVYACINMLLRGATNTPIARKE